MISSLNLFIILILIPGSLLLLRYFFKLRDRGHKTEILEIKLRAMQKKIDQEKQEISEVHKRLDEQKNPLEKKWDEIQAGDKILESKAVKLQQDRELLEKQKYEIERLKTQLQENQDRIEAVNQHLKIKWEHERQEIEIRKNELISILKQIKIEKASIESQQSQINNERQILLDERKKIIKKTKECEILKIYFENQKKEIAEERLHAEHEQKKNIIEWKKLEQEREDHKLVKTNISKETDILKKKAAELFAKENSIEKQNKQFEHEKYEFEQAKLKFEKLLIRTTIHAITQVKEGLEDATSNKESALEPIPDQTKMRLSEELTLKDVILEIHSWKKNEIWHFGLNIINLSSKKTNFQIFQEDKILSKAEPGNDQWEIKSFSPVIVRWRDGSEFIEKTFQIIPDQIDSPLIFKLQFPDYGRLMKYLSNGSYLMVVPVDWKLDEKLSCQPSVEKELTSIDGYLAYKLSLTGADNSILVYRKPDAKTLCFARQKNRFLLSTNHSIDLSEIDNPLFCAELPSIIDQEKSWKDVQLIILRDHDYNYQNLQRLPSSLVASNDFDLNLLESRGEGALNKTNNLNFLCDIYDQFNVLLESVKFRFIDYLKAVVIPDYPIVPGKNGHEALQIEFMHDENCEIKLSPGDSANVEMMSNDIGTIAKVFPVPTLDVINWVICDDQDRELSLTTRLDRVWWQLTKDSKIPQKINAKDVPLLLSLSELNNMTDLGIYIWIPPAFESKKISIGLEKNSAKEFQWKKDEPGIFAPLKVILNEQQTLCSKNHLQIKMWTENKEDENIILANLIQSQLICKVKNCDFKTTSKHEMNKHIKHAHFIHLLKELSYNEIRSNYNNNLPVEIYQCGYCKEYIFAEQNTDNPVFSIMNHINKCPNVNSNNGNPFISFRIVNDLQELKNLAIPEIPLVSKCLLCNKLFTNPGEEELYHHFVQFHEKDLIGEAKDEFLI